MPKTMKTLRSPIKKHILLSCLSLLLGTWLGAVPAHALLVEYVIQNGTQGNFGFSDVHDATGVYMQYGSAEYWASGAVLSGTGIAGSLIGDQQIIGSTVTLTGIQGTLSATNGLTLAFTNGSLTGDTGTAFNAGGFLDVTLSHASIAGGSRMETFYFHPQQFTSPAPGANTFDGLLFGLWGNNWNNGVDPEPSVGNTGTLNSNRLGLDLRGTLSSVAPVPLPGAAWLFGSALASLLPLLRRQFLS
jgi:hypothetical protein